MFSAITYVYWRHLRNKIKLLRRLAIVQWAEWQRSLKEREREEEEEEEEKLKRRKNEERLYLCSFSITSQPITFFIKIAPKNGGVLPRAGPFYSPS